jgi:hypothetical protein
VKDSINDTQFYGFKFEGGVNNSYVFKTDYDIRYEIKFVPSGYLWESEPFFKDYTFEFIIAVLENNTGKKPPLDKKIPITLQLICEDFFQNNKNTAVYICDSSDNKQAIRFRKFNDWFVLMKNRAYVKMDMTIPDENEVYIYTSLIMRADNPYMDSIMIEFKHIMDEPPQK